jgi:hypothetical protein
MASDGKVRVLDPSGYVQTKALRLAPRLESLHGKTVGLLDDGLPNANTMLDRIAQLLQETHGVASVVNRRKPNLSAPAPKALFEELKAQVDFVVVGLGG